MKLRLATSGSNRWLPRRRTSRAVPETGAMTGTGGGAGMSGGGGLLGRATGAVGGRSDRDRGRRAASGRSREAPPVLGRRVRGDGNSGRRQGADCRQHRRLWAARLEALGRHSGCGHGLSYGVAREERASGSGHTLAPEVRRAAASGQGGASQPSGTARPDPKRPSRGDDSAERAP